MSPKLSGTTYYVYLMDIAMSICFKIRDTSYYLVHIMEGWFVILMEVSSLFGIAD